MGEVGRGGSWEKALAHKRGDEGRRPLLHPGIPESTDHHEPLLPSHHQPEDEATADGGEEAEETAPLITLSRCWITTPGACLASEPHFL